MSATCWKKLRSFSLQFFFEFAPTKEHKLQSMEK